MRLEDAEDLVAYTEHQKLVHHFCKIPLFASPDKKKHTGDGLDLGNTVGVTEDDTDLRGRGTLPGELADLVRDLVGRGLEPRRRVPRVRDRRRRDTLALAVKPAHFVGCGVSMLVIGVVVGAVGWAG